MTRFHQFPLLLLALLALFVLAPLSGVNAETEVVTANQQLCITCRDGGDCSKAYFGLVGKFCYDYTEAATGGDKTACCCGSTFTCGASNATTTECNCDYTSTSTKKPSSTTAAPKKETKGTSPWVWVGVGVGALFIIIIVGVGYVYCMRYQTKRAMSMMNEAHVQNTMTTAQQQQLQTVYTQHGGQLQGGRYNNGNASFADAAPGRRAARRSRFGTSSLTPRVLRRSLNGDVKLTDATLAIGNTQRDQEQDTGHEGRPNCDMLHWTTTSLICGTSNTTTTMCEREHSGSKEQLNGFSNWYWAAMRVGIFFFIIAFTFCYVYCQKKLIKRVLGMMQEAHYQNTTMEAHYQNTTMVLQYQLQTNDMYHHGSGGGQQQYQRR